MVEEEYPTYEPNLKDSGDAQEKFGGGNSVASEKS